MDKRYQVFVSSTYTDLKEERQHVSQTLMEMDCIPAGMELFPAVDEEQWEFIKKIIDDCDYYLLIIGGRYGSTTEEGISYTEKEYEYAVEKGLKVVAFLHENPDDISDEKAEEDPMLQEKLLQFRDKVSRNRMVKFWKAANDLPGLVALSMSKTIKMFPTQGWVRASNVSNEDLLEDINELRKENTLLKSELSKYTLSATWNVEDLAGLDETFKIHGTYYSYSHNTIYNWEETYSWREIFNLISPYLNRTPNHNLVKYQLAEAIKAEKQSSRRDFKINDSDFETIAIQLKALGFINTKYTTTTKGGMDYFWSLTPNGERLMVELRTLRTNNTKN